MRKITSRAGGGNKATPLPEVMSIQSPRSSSLSGRAFYVSEVAAILSRRNFKGPLKNVAHRIDVPEAALAGDCFHAVLTFFQSTASGFNAQPFHKFRGRGLHFFGEDPGEIARTHRDP